MLLCRYVAIVNQALNSPSQDFTHPDDRTPLSYDMTPGFKPFTMINCANYEAYRIMSVIEILVYCGVFLTYLLLAPRQVCLVIQYQAIVRECHSVNSVYH